MLNKTELALNWTVSIIEEYENYSNTTFPLSKHRFVEEENKPSPDPQLEHCSAMVWSLSDS